MNSCIVTFFTTSHRFLILIFAISLSATAFNISAQQSESDEDEMARMQAQLNGEVMSRPFLAEKPEEVDAYIKSMLEKNVKPQEYQGSYWKPGYTCRDLLRYNWTEYRNCSYYYRYHGRYYY